MVSKEKTRGTSLFWSALYQLMRGPKDSFGEKGASLYALDRAQTIALLSHDAHHRPRKRGSAPRVQLRVRILAR